MAKFAKLHQGQWFFYYSILHAKRGPKTAVDLLTGKRVRIDASERVRLVPDDVVAGLHQLALVACDPNGNVEVRLQRFVLELLEEMRRVDL